MRFRWPLGKRRSGQIMLLAITLVCGLPPIYMWIATPPPGAVELADGPPDQDYALYVANWGYHSSVIMEQPEGWQLGPPGAEGAAFVEYSWGDRNFYMDFNRDPVSAVRAMVLPTDSVLFVQGWNRAPSLVDGIQQLYHRSINGQQWRELIMSLEQDFLRTKTGERSAALVVETPYQGRFYSGREFYIGWSACNAWTVRHLAQIGVAKDSWGIIVADQVAPQLRGFKAHQND